MTPGFNSLPGFAFYLLITSVLLGCTTQSAQRLLGTAAQSTTFYVVRHAEKELGSAPGLTPQGAARAQFYVDFFADTELTQVYSTPTRRTFETATPLAQSKNLEVEEYANGLEFGEFTQGLITKHPGEHVFIVGHSNTVPLLINGLSRTSDYADVPHDDFERLYQVVVQPSGQAEVRLFRVPIADELQTAE